MTSSRSSLWKWYLCGLLLLATTINYMDRVTLANASVRVTKEFALSEQQYGNLELAFGWAFAAGSLVFGFLADRLRVYWLYPVVLAGWSVMGMASGWAHGYTELLVCRTLLGFFEAGHWPCALKTTFAVLNEKDRTMGNSILQSGASIGAVITPQVMKLLMTDELGTWRLSFVAVGAAGLVWVLVWLVMMRSQEIPVTIRRGATGRAEDEEPLIECPTPIMVGAFVGMIVGMFASYFVQPVTLRLTMSFGDYIHGFEKILANPGFYRTVMVTMGGGLLVGGYLGVRSSLRQSKRGGGILLGRSFWALALLIFGAQTVWHIYRVWLMKFLQTGRGYEEAAALNFNSLYYIFTDVGCVAAGLVSMWLIRKRSVSPHGARRIVYAGACVLTSLSLTIPWLGKGWLLLGVILMIGAGALALFPCYYSFVQELSGQHVGRLTGLLSMWVWAVTSPMHSFFGMVADKTKSYDVGLVIAGLAPWLGVIAMKLLWDGGKTQQSADSVR